jgi:demethylmenaquinone methyltransferase/2-methoxy-6-polyprenyl-1,4-benzoquinol methylase
MSVDQANLSGIRVLDHPVGPEEKAHYVAEMFDAIAPRYDLLNSLLSARLDRNWRRFAAKCTALSSGDRALDVCSGTGDFAHELRLRVGPSGEVTATDFSAGMLAKGKEKFTADNVNVLQADAMDLPFADNTFDAAVVGFGLRNVVDPAKAIAEMVRVVKPMGRVVCLEFSQPHGKGLLGSAFKLLFNWSSKAIMPIIGGLVSGRREAYSYLAESIVRWKTPEQISDIMIKSGLVDIRTRILTFGLVCVHIGVKYTEATMVVEQI